MKKILIIMGGYLPGKKYGGPPVSVDNFCTLMKGQADCYVLTHNHDMGDKKPYANILNGWNDRGNAKVRYLSDENYNYSSFKATIIEIQPDYLYLQGLFQACVLPCLIIAKKNNLKVVLAPRGELCSGAFKKKYKKIPYIVFLRSLRLLNNVSFQSTSDDETIAIEKYLGVSEERIHHLTNIPSIPKNLPLRPQKSKGVGRFVFISRILWKKNLLRAIKFLYGIKGLVTFDIYGPKEDEKYWTECKSAIDSLPDNVKVNYCGIISHDDIHITFNQYDAFLFPTLSENYGHVIAEALVTGCIPIISDQTPWTDINGAEAGWAIALDKEDDFINAVQEIVDLDEYGIELKRKAIEAYLKRKFQMDELREEYISVFK